MARSVREPDEKRRVKVPGGEVQTFSYGHSDEVLLLLHGGPAMPSPHIRNTHSWLVDHGFGVVTWDQLGCGESEIPDNPSLWSPERACEEVEAVRSALDLGVVQLYGHSWGAMLALVYALTYPNNIKSLVIANGLANVPFHQREADRMLAAFGPEFVQMRLRHELNGTTDSPEYQAAEVLLRYRHICRLPYWPEEMQRDIDAINPQPFKVMFGGSEWHVGGTLKNWNMVPELPKIKHPTLVLVGEHDELTPKEAWEIHQALPNSRFRMFEGVAHMLMYECPEEYGQELLKFFQENRGRR